MTYYDRLIPSLTYVISPYPSSLPALNYTFSSDYKTINVVIPATEQTKFSIGIDYKIIFTVYWTNSIYATLIDTSTYTF